MSLPGLSRATVGLRLPGAAASSAIRKPGETLYKLASSTTAIAIGVYAATRIISVWAFLYLLPQRSFRPIRRDFGIWNYLTRSSDAFWYSTIAQHGYQHSAPGTFHFYPGYPAAIDTLAWIPGMGIAGAGIVVTAIAGLVAAAGLAQLGLRLTGDSRVSVLLVALWAVAPGAFVLSMVYSEALACALAVWALVAVADRRWLTAGVLTMLAGTVHSSAVTLVAAVAVAALVSVIESARTGLPLSSWLRPVAAVVIAPLGLIGFSLFVTVGLRVPGGWFGAESAAGQRIDWGASTWHAVVTTLAAPNVFSLLSVLAILAAIGLTAWTLTERMPAYLKVYVVCTVLLAVLTGPGSLGSKPRIVLPALLLGFPLAKILAPSRNYVLIPMIAILAAASAWFTLIQSTAGIPP